MAKLEIFLPDSTNLTHELSEQRVTLGRVADNDLQIDDESISSHHAEFIEKDGEFLLRDLQSTNGTLINGDSIKEQILKDGDLIRFGKVDATFTATEDASSQSEQVLESAESSSAVAGATTSRPSDFFNTSPFPKVQEGRSLIRIAGFVLAGISVIAFGVASYAVFFLMAAPEFVRP